MERPKSLLPAALLSAGLLLGGRFAFGVLAAAVVPRLIDWLDKSPRVAMAGFLLLILSPWLFVSLGHRLTHRAMDRFDEHERRDSDSSLWAGAFAWLVLFGTDLLSTFVMLVIDPPEPDAARATFASAIRAVVLGDGALVATHLGVWFVIAAFFYGLERAARPARAQ